MRAVAINVGANTNEPGFRGSVLADGSFEYIPIPEPKPTAEFVPTYGDLSTHLETPIPDEIADIGTHLDPEFPEYPFCERYTYGDEHGIKASPLGDLSAGDYVFFYATLSVAGSAAWLPPEWGAFVIGQFRLGRDPLTPADEAVLSDEEAEFFANNAHCKRENFDARVLLAGDPDGSRLYDEAVPLSTADGGANANELVTEYSSDSGRGPWWRRPLRFDAEATEHLRSVVAVR